METHQLVRLPNGRFVRRISVKAILRSAWHLLSGEQYRVRREWKAKAEKAEADRKRRSEAGKKAWDTRRRNAEIARALDAYDAVMHEPVITTDNIEGVPV